MKLRMHMAVAALSMFVPAAHAETPIQPGLWEKTEKLWLDGEAVPSRPDQRCLKASDASLERLLLLADDEASARGCKREVSAPGPEQVKMSLSCPASDAGPALSVTLELKYAPTSFEGLGTIELKDKDGHQRKGTSQLSGKRLGDC
jgi:hypothetical protein